MAAEESRTYQREWRKANPDKVRVYNATYWRRRAERKLAKQQEWGQGDDEQQNSAKPERGSKGAE